MVSGVLNYVFEIAEQLVVHGREVVERSLVKCVPGRTPRCEVGDW